MKNPGPKKKVASPEFPLAAMMLSVLFPALGIALFFLPVHGYESYHTQSKASSWPKVPGVVVSSTVIEDERSRDEDTMYRADIWIRYVVKETTYVINGLYIGDTKSWSSDNIGAHQLSRDYAVGREVQVSYSPDNPSVAVVETNIKIISVVLFLLMLMFTFFGMLLMYKSVIDIYRFVRHYVIRWTQ